MSLAKAAPVEQLLAPRFLCRIVEGTSFLRVQGRPERLVASEYIGTCASGYIPGHTRDLHSEGSQVQLSRCRGQPQPQGCKTDARAMHTGFVVPPDCVDRREVAPPREKPLRPKRVAKEKSTLPRRSVTGPIERQGVFNGPILILLLEGLVAEGGLKQEFPRMLDNSLHRPLGVAAPVWQSFSCTPQFARPVSSSTTIALMDVPDGYQAYQKLRDEEAAEGTSWPTLRSTRWSRRARTVAQEASTSEGGGEECDNSKKNEPKFSYPLRRNVSPPNVVDFRHKRFLAGADTENKVKFSSCKREEINGTYQRNSDVEKRVWCPKVPGRRSETRCPEVFSETGRPARRDACQEPRSQQQEKFEHRNVGDPSGGEDVGEVELSERKMNTQVSSKTFQEKIQEHDGLECEGPAGPKMHDEAIGFNFEGEMVPTIADEKLNKSQQRATALDQSSQETRVMSNNHAAYAHDDRSGGSHVVCLDHSRGMEFNEKVYWRRSYMLNGLKAAGWSIKDAYTAFQYYQGKERYEQLQLQPPQPAPRDEACESEWSHMSDYDEMGLAPYQEEEGGTELEAPTNNLADEDNCRGQQHERTVWHSDGHGYRVQGWGTTKDGTTEDDNNRTLGCMIPMSKRSRRTTIPDDSDTEDERSEMVCNMIGQFWESLLFPIIIGLGACASVMPTSWCTHVPFHETQQSKAGDYYRSANGSKIYHEAERVVSMTT